MAIVIQKWMTTTRMIRTLPNMKSTQRAVVVDLCLYHLRMTLRQSYLILEKLFFFTNNGWSGLAKVKYFSLDETNVLSIVVTNSNGDDIITTKEYLCFLSNPYVGWIPSSVLEYKQSGKTLSEKDIEKITSPKNLSPLQQEFLSVHYKLNHLPFTIMLWLYNMSIIPRRFLKLRNDFPPCVYCLF